MLVNTGKELVLFDTGNGSLSAEYEQMKGRLPPGNLVARMAQAGYKPEDVDVVVITHGHPDHIGGLTKGGQPVFPNARYVFGAAEFDFWNKGENVREARKFNRELYVKIVVPLANRATMIKPGDEVVPGIRAVDAFGSFARLAGLHHRERRQAAASTGPTPAVIMWCRCSGRTCISTSTTTRRRRWPPASASSTWWRPTNCSSPASTCRSRGSAMSRRQRQRLSLGAA